MEYDQAARKRLGRAVRAARTSAGYDNRGDFADKMKRSARQVQALENGESGVGPDTWAAAAEALEWPIERVYGLLEGGAPAKVAPPELASVSTEDLAAEVLRRMKAGEGDVERDPAPMKMVARRGGATKAERVEAAEEGRRLRPPKNGEEPLTEDETA